MHIAGGSLALLVALALSLSASANDPSFSFDVEEWRTDWLGYSDDFQDGALWDGNPSTEPTHYFANPVGCGRVDDGDEEDGRLRLQGADCAAAPSAFGPASETTVRATFRFAVPSFDGGYGVSVSNGGTDRVTLSLNRITETDPDSLLALLTAEPAGVPEDPMIVVKYDVISLDADNDDDLIGVQAIDLKLDLALDPGNSALIPTGSYRLCSESPCEDETTKPFQPIGDDPPGEPPPDQGALAVGETHSAALVAFSNDGSSFAFDVEEWSQTASASDDFEDGVFPGHLPYVFAESCGDSTKVAKENGKLTLLGPNAPCNGLVLSFAGSQPGELVSQAKYVFEIPDRCEAYGVSLGHDSPLDFASLMLWRSQDPDAPASRVDVLNVALLSEPEAGDPAPRVVAKALVSANPQDDPGLAEFEAIEFRLALTRSAPGEPLVPTPGFRLCTASGCPEPFTPLDPYVPGPDPDALVCGTRASQLDPPADQGVVSSLEYLGTSLFATSANSGTLTIELDPGIVNGFGAEDIAVDPRPGIDRIYVANADSNSVSVIDGDTGTFVKNIAVGLGPSIVEVNTSTNKIYVVNEDGDTVSVIDGSADAVEATIPVGPSPSSLIVHQGTNEDPINRIYVLNADDGTLSVIDGAANAVEATLGGLGGGGHPLNMGINRTARRVYVANTSDGTLSVIDADPASEDFNSVIDSIDPGLSSWGELFIAVDETTDRNRVYILNWFYGPWHGETSLAVFDGATQDPIGDVIPLPGVYDVEALTVNESTNYLYVGHEAGISILDGSTNTVVPPPPDCCHGVEHMAVNESTDLIYATADDSPLVLDGDPDSPSFHEVFSPGVDLGQEGLAINEVTNRVYVVGNWGGLLVFDAAMNPPPALVSTGGTAYDLAFDSVNNRVWVAHSSTVGSRGSTRPRTVSLRPPPSTCRPVSLVCCSTRTPIGFMHLQ